MKRLIAISLTLLAMGYAQFGMGETEFLTHPEKLQPDERFDGAPVYWPDDVLERIQGYDSLMVDEPIIFIAKDSPYEGFKPSDLAAVSDLVRRGFMKGLSEQNVSFGNFKTVDKPGPTVLYVRLALKDVYIRKNKRGLFAYTPVGAVLKGVHDVVSDAIDKSTLVELKLEAEMQDTQTGEVLFAGIIDRGQRKDKAAHVKEEAAGWEVTGAVAELLGRRLACRLDNARLPEDKRTDCIKEISFKG